MVAGEVGEEELDLVRVPRRHVGVCCLFLGGHGDIADNEGLLGLGHVVHHSLEHVLDFAEVFLLGTLALGDLLLAWLLSALARLLRNRWKCVDLERLA